MKIGVYDIINNPNPSLVEIKIISIKGFNLLSDSAIVDMFNTYLYMDKLSSEHIYALSLNYDCKPNGIIQVAIGKSDGCECNLKQLATGLLLTGAEQFMCFHNHPGGVKSISYDDCELTKKYRKLGELLDITFLKHIMITKDYYTICEEVDEGKYVFGTEVEL